MAEKTTVRKNTAAKKENCIAQVAERPLAAKKGCKSMIVLTSIPLAVWVNDKGCKLASSA